MNANQFKAWLGKQGCMFETKRGTGHIIVRLGDKKTELPMHGGGKELGKGLVEHIKKRLGLK
jgi:mRNA interferase HicA